MSPYNYSQYMKDINFLNRYRERERRRRTKPVVLTLEVLAVFMIGYILLAPFEPLAVYDIFMKNSVEPAPDEAVAVPANTEKIGSNIIDIANAAGTANKAVPSVSPKTASVKQAVDTVKRDNRLVIATIGVDAHISTNKNPRTGLNEGVWMDPSGSTPNKGGNTVIAGHRWKYLPPNNTTFYLLDKVKVGDEMSTTWNNKKYVYKVKEVKIVDPDDAGILSPTHNPTLTLYTCTPLFSMKHRLVVISELMQ